MLEIFKVMGQVEIDPIHQFQIQKWFDLGTIGGQQLWITNATGFMLLSSALVVLLFGIAASRGQMVPSRLQSIGELGYGFVADMIRSIAGEEGLKFFPFIFTLFFFVLAANVVGLVPYAFTTTSHIAVTLPLALLVISIVIIYGFYKNGFRFLKLFMPSGAPWWVYILLIPIEIISFFVRPLTLSLRLFCFEAVCVVHSWTCQSWRGVDHRGILPFCHGRRHECARVSCRRPAGLYFRNAHLRLHQ